MIRNNLIDLKIAIEREEEEEKNKNKTNILRTHTIRNAHDDYINNNNNNEKKLYAAT